MILSSSVCKYLNEFTIASCLLSFWFVTYHTIKEYHEGKTVVASDLQVSDSLKSPVLLICNKTSFKKRILRTDIDEYQNNTLTKEEFLLQAMFVQNTVKNGNPFSNVTSIKEKIYAIPTLFYGNCFVIAPSILVRQLFCR